MGLFGLASCMPTRTWGAVIPIACGVCEKAWKSLGRFTKTRYQFRYIEPVANLPKVFIYGDSISIGYTEYVRASLEGKASVFRLHKNGQSSNDFVPNMEKLKTTMFQPYLEGGWNFKWDVIHFNVGLHDLKYMANGKMDKKRGVQVSSLELYATNLKKIINYLKTSYPKAKLVFATTTPVPDGEPGRVKGDAKKYNEVAIKVLKEHPDIIVNDLYSFSVPLLKKYAIGPGNVHYKEEGSRRQGIRVAKVIAKALDLKPNKCPSTEIITTRFKEYESNKRE